ncbi:YraN family protein [Mycobacteroides chelonae]|uniref:UPF0102 protein FJK96_16175 n=1 Tax=Mycobacteroides chelonae TaxID=1774 RepID=A0AB73U3M5_MYCCH|nr:YraN family protein [Mycobacteroides chelonae]MEC4840811.1 YraN family protein [Mycobacteroides chelonae]MEC4843058.1 YraN family protein [Mycobacteroides chelonae]QDF71538.1 YraN family protein [Mycobacteroides chelonae]WED92379.1 YraN family protein [Mycobacteroides chelonae]WED95402.1 YraN family protein [Mycobacteroides chelonae]
MTTSTRAQIGSRGEDLAADYLSKDGFTVLDRNWRCRYGELDIIAADGEVLVFVEVKTRTGRAFGTPAEAVTHTKLRRLRRHWLGYRCRAGRCQWRWNLLGLPISLSARLTRPALGLLCS